jgi:competence ComEA-like helix-hairpin-helix protein
MQANIKKNKSQYFNISAYRLNKKPLVILTLGAILLAGCGQDTEIKPATVQNSFADPENAVNLNTAGVAELETIPGIGRETAKKIIAHREKYGKFRRVEHLMLVRGVSDKKFRELRAFVKAD